MFLKNQNNTEIFSCFLLLLPCMLSTCYQTNEGNTGNISDDFLYFSRIRLHLLLDTNVVSDEEGESLSSILLNRRANISLVQHQSQVLFPTRTLLGEESAGSLLCGFHSCFKEILGGGRGDMYTFSYKTSPVFSLTTFGIQ